MQPHRTKWTGFRWNVQIFVKLKIDSNAILFSDSMFFEKWLTLTSSVAPNVQTVVSQAFVAVSVPHTWKVLPDTVTSTNSFSVHYTATIKTFLNLAILSRHYLVRWRSGATGKALDLQSTGRGFKSCSGQKLHNNLGQVVHTYMSLSPSSITWYRPRSSDALRLGR